MINDNSEEYIKVDDPENISDEQLIQISLLGLDINSIQPGVEYVVDEKWPGVQGTVIFSQVNSDGITQYNYLFRNDGDWNSPEYLCLRKNVYNRIKKDTDSHAVYSQYRTEYYYDQEKSDLEMKKIIIDENYIIQKESACWRKARNYRLFLRTVYLLLYITALKVIGKRIRKKIQKKEVIVSSMLLVFMFIFEVNYRIGKYLYLRHSTIFDSNTGILVRLRLTWFFLARSIDLSNYIFRLFAFAAIWIGLLVLLYKKDNEYIVKGDSEICMRT